MTACKESYNLDILMAAISLCQSGDSRYCIGIVKSNEKLACLYCYDV